MRQVYRDAGQPLLGYDDARPENHYSGLTSGRATPSTVGPWAPTTPIEMDHELEDTQQIEPPLDLDAEIWRLLTRLQKLLPDHPVDPGHRLLAALIAMWPELPTVGERFEAAANLLTLGQRDVWFLTKTDPVE